MDAETRAAALLDAAPVGLMVVDASATITWVSPSVYDLTGYGNEDVVGTSILDYLHEVAVAGLLESVAYVQEHTDAIMGPSQLAFIHADGEPRVLEAYATNRFDDPAIGGLVVAVRDQTFQFRINEALEASAAGAPVVEVLRLLTASLIGLPVHGPAALVDPMTGAPLAETRLPDALLGPSPDPDRPRPWEVAASTGEQVTPADLDAYDHDFRDAASVAGFLTMWAVPVLPHGCFVIGRDLAGEPTINEGYTLATAVRSTSLVMEKEFLLGELARAAQTDPLTGLANRAHLGSREANGSVALLYVDLDGFKPVNDEYGHPAGDAVLQEVAHRLTVASRGGDEVGRIGGDEFALVCWDVEDPAQVTALADRIHDALALPIAIDEALVTIGASIGIALDPSGTETFDDLLRRADGALYEAKRAGKNCWRLAEADGAAERDAEKNSIDAAPSGMMQ